MKPSTKYNYLKYSDSSLPAGQFSCWICVINRTFILPHIWNWNLTCCFCHLIASTLFSGLPSVDNSTFPGFFFFLHDSLPSTSRDTLICAGISSSWETAIASNPCVLDP